MDPDADLAERRIAAIDVELQMIRLEIVSLEVGRAWPAGQSPAREQRSHAAALIRERDELFRTRFRLSGR